MRALFDLLLQLLDVPSVTGSEGAIARRLARMLEDRGLPAVLFPVDGDRSNVVAIPPDSSVVLCTHMDTVGPLLPVSEDDRWIHGRGACDAKGALAAMIVAAERLRSAGEPVPGLLFVVGEETNSDGARAANRQSSRLAPSARWLVVGEPTGNRTAAGQKGVLQFELEVAGSPAHSGYPHLGRSAVHTLLDVLDRLRSADFGTDPILGPATLNVGTLQGGSASNVLAERAQASVFVRLVGPVADAESILEEAVGDASGVRVTLGSRSDPVVCTTFSDRGGPPVAFGSDLPHLTGFGVPLLVGPGSIEWAHGSRERVGKDELVEAVEVYERIVRGLHGMDAVPPPGASP